jgi:hypothetical protein
MKSNSINLKELTRLYHRPISVRVHKLVPYSHAARRFRGYVGIIEKFLVSPFLSDPPNILKYATKRTPTYLQTSLLHFIAIIGIMNGDVAPLTLQHK